MKRQPLLKHTQIIRLSRILDMMYKPKELASEIGVTLDTLYRSYLPAGLPHIQDKQGIWIYGPAFVAWAKETVAKSRRKRAPLPDGHAWCMKCNQAVVMKNPKVKYRNHYIEILQSKCPHCKSLINRAQRKETAGGES